MDRLVVDVHPCVRPHLQGLLDGICGLVGANGQDGDCALIAPLGGAGSTLDQLQAGLNRILVELGKQTVDAQPDRGVVQLVERALRLGVGHVLDTDHDVHRWLVLFRRGYEFWFWVMSPGRLAATSGSRLSCQPEPAESSACRA